MKNLHSFDPASFAAHIERAADLMVWGTAVAPVAAISATLLVAVYLWRSR